jgi:protein-S-isoprenylcysteine O-methyltransferase Ste14
MVALAGPLVLAVWVAFWIYLVLVARGTRRSLAVESWTTWVPRRVLQWGGIAVILLPASHRGLLGHAFLPRSDLVLVLGDALAVAGLGLTVWARRTLGPLWSASVTLKEGHTRVTAGPYAWFRHPMYVGFTIALAGTALVATRWADLLGVAMIIAAFWLKARFENRWLARHLGPDA